MMAIKKIQKNRMNDAGTFDVIHYETDASQVLMADGTTAEAAIGGKETAGAAAQALADAKNYTDTKIAGIPTPDVSGQINTHNADVNAHSSLFGAKADLVNGVVPSNQLPAETDPTVPDWAKQPNKPNYTANEVGALPNTTPIPSSLSDLTDDATHRLVTDDQKQAWSAKAPGTHASQHASTGSDPITPAAIGAIPTTQKGAASGVASLDSSGKVPSEQLPEISSVKTYIATIGTTWTKDENTGVKHQNVAISGVLSTHTAKVDHAYTGSGTSDDYAAFVEAENQYLTYITNGYAETYNGGLKFYIFGDAPTVEIPVVVEVS